MDPLNFTNATFSLLPKWEHDFVNVFPFLHFLSEQLMYVSVIWGIPGNLAVIILKPNWENLSEVTQSLMMNLAVSDLLCLCTVPFWIYNMTFGWTLGTATCKIVAFTSYCSVQCSLLTVTALSVQRYVQVIHQQRCLQFKKALLVLLWLSSMALSIPSLVCREGDYGCDPIYSSQGQQVAVLLTESFVGLISFTVTACSYNIMKSRLNQAVFFNNPSTSRLLNRIIVACFVLWMPYVVFNLVTVGGILNENSNIVDFYILGLNLFASGCFMNSCVNPLLYAFSLGICHKKTPPTATAAENLHQVQASG